MAIWQFNLTAIPRKGVLEKYEVIPKTVDRSFLEDLNLWTSTSLDINTLIDGIDKIVKRADYGNENWFNWKTETEEVDNDASLSLNEITKKVENLNFRADLREKGLIYLNEVIDLAREYNWMFVDLKGNLISHSRDEIIKSIEMSNAYKFLSNPQKFLDGFIKGEIKPE